MEGWVVGIGWVGGWGWRRGVGEGTLHTPPSSHKPTFLHHAVDQIHRLRVAVAARRRLLEVPQSCGGGFVHVEHSKNCRGFLTPQLMGGGNKFHPREPSAQSKARLFGSFRDALSLSVIVPNPRLVDPLPRDTSLRRPTHWLSRSDTRRPLHSPRKSPLPVTASRKSHWDGALH